MNSLIKRYWPRARDCRRPFSDPVLKATRPKFFKAAIINFILLQLVFFGLFCYLFGALYQQVPRTHNLNILWVDFDGGIIGSAVRDAYTSLASNEFPTLVEKPTSDYPSVQSLREAVCNTDYWAAVYTVSGSSQNLGLTIAGSNSTPYNPSNVLIYIWNEARYPTIADSSIAGNIATLSNAARLAYVSLNGTGALATIPPGNKAAMTAFANPWTLSSINIQPTIQGTRAVYNTICIVLIIIQDFFFLGAINGLYAQFKIYTRAKPSIITLVREFISLIFTMVGSMLIASAIWAFRSGWAVSGSQWALCWLTIWLLAHVNFLTLDVFTIWIPPPFVPMALISWVILNVTSIIIPFALSSPFYRWGYALPAHAAYDILTDIWSGGCSPHLSYALPVLFAYELSGIILTTLGVYKRCHMAVVAEEAALAAIEKRIKEAIKATEGSSSDVRPQTSRSRRRSSAVRKDEQVSGGAEGQNADPTREEKDMEPGQEPTEAEIQQEAADLERIKSGASQFSPNFGPSFRLIGSEES